MIKFNKLFGILENGSIRISEASYKASFSIRQHSTVIDVLTLFLSFLFRNRHL